MMQGCPTHGLLALPPASWGPWEKLLIVLVAISLYGKNRSIGLLEHEQETITRKSGMWLCGRTYALHVKHLYRSL